MMNKRLFVFFYLLCALGSSAQELITDPNFQLGVNAKGTVPTNTVMGSMQFTTGNGFPA